MEKYFNPEIYHRQSYRLADWDYTKLSYYFITVCVRYRDPHFFGKIFDGKIELNEIGIFVRDVWLNLPKHFNNVELDEFIVMPNHVHGVLRIVGTCHGMSLQNNHTRMSLQNNTNKFSKPIKGSLSMMINHFKGACTRKLKQQGIIHVSFWQPRFHDRIIRDEHELNNVRRYIKNNPRNWERDRNNRQGIWI